MDARTNIQKFLDAHIGRPLYYCEECNLSVDVSTIEGEVVIKRQCEHTGRILAPRKSILSGKGYAGLSNVDKIKTKYAQLMANLTGRCV